MEERCNAGLWNRVTPRTISAARTLSLVSRCSSNIKPYDLGMNDEMTLSSLVESLTAQFATICWQGLRRHVRLQDNSHQCLPCHLHTLATSLSLAANQNNTETTSGT